MTPYASEQHIRAWSENRKAERRLTLTAAYMTARLGLTDPKKFPKLEQIIGRDDQERHKIVEQTDKEFSASFMRWAAKVGIEEKPT